MIMCSKDVTNITYNKILVGDFGVACDRRRFYALFEYYRRGVVFIYMKTIQTGKVYIINDQKSNQ